MASEAAVFYYDVQKGDIVIAEDPFEGDEPDADLLDAVEQDPGRYVRLPGEAELEAYNLARRFAHTCPDDARQVLERAAAGLYAHVEFGSRIRELGLGEAWRAFCEAGTEQVARAWADENGVVLTEP